MKKPRSPPARMNCCPIPTYCDNSSGSCTRRPFRRTCRDACGPDRCGVSLPDPLVAKLARQPHLSTKVVGPDHQYIDSFDGGYRIRIVDGLGSFQHNDHEHALIHSINRLGHRVISESAAEASGRRPTDCRAADICSCSQRHAPERRYRRAARSRPLRPVQRPRDLAVMMVGHSDKRRHPSFECGDANLGCLIMVHGIVLEIET